LADTIRLRGHGIAFDNAKLIFDGPTVEREDDRFDYGETRGGAIGLDERDRDPRPGGPNRMNDDSSGTASKTEPAKRLRTMTDAEVHAGVVAIQTSPMSAFGRMRAS
jgi:hypothetical protein